MPLFTVCMIFSGYSAEFATRLATSVYQETVQTLKLSPTEVQEFETLSRNVLTSVGQLQEEHQRLSMRVNSCIAGSLVSLVCLPEKLNPIVRPLMDCIKMEADGVMQVGVARRDGHTPIYNFVSIATCCLLAKSACGYLSETSSLPELQDHQEPLQFCLL